ncbi:MAG TPA: hypothetical protein VN903_39280 [Polyangia bacterium]|nr:hypothetical protein [Polyangia bacterium]
MSVMVVGLVLGGCGPSSSSGPGSFGVPDATGHCAAAYAATGGDPAGTWSVVSACLEGDPVAAMNSHLTSACPNVVRGYKVESAIGMATLSAGAISNNDAAVTIREDRVVSSSCHQATNATPILGQSDCDNYAGSLTTGLRGALDSSCTYENDGCTCWNRMEYTLDGSTYTTTQTNLTVGPDVLPFSAGSGVLTLRIRVYDESGIQVRLQRLQR